MIRAPRVAMTRPERRVMTRPERRVMTLRGRPDARTDPQWRFEEAVRNGKSEEVREILLEGEVNPAARENAALKTAVKNKDKNTLLALSTTIWDPAYAAREVDPRAVSAAAVPPEIYWHFRRLEAMARERRGLL